MGPQPGKSAFIGVFLAFAATLVYEILLTRIFSVTLMYHFAFMAVPVYPSVSIPLFFSGICMCLALTRFPDQAGGRRYRRRRHGVRHLDGPLGRFGLLRRRVLRFRGHDPAGILTMRKPAPQTA